MKTTITISIERAVSRELERLHRITGCSSEEICARAITKELGLAGSAPTASKAASPAPKKRKRYPKTPILKRKWRHGALELIALSDDPLRSSAITKMLGMSMGMTHFVINDLADAGYIEIVGLSKDTAARLYSATPKGFAALEAK